MVEYTSSMIALIAAIQAGDRGLGIKNNLLYQIPADMKYFKDITMGHPVPMGRKTWESIPQKFRPLSGRKNIVITGQKDYTAEGAVVCANVQQAITMAQQHDPAVFIIGGAQVYQEALPYADTLYLTIIEGNKPADVFFPDYTNDFHEESSEGPFTTDDGISYRFAVFKRK